MLKFYVGSSPIFSTEYGTVVAKVADRTVTPGVERLYVGSSPISTARLVVSDFPLDLGLRYGTLKLVHWCNGNMLDCLSGATSSILVWTAK